MPSASGSYGRLAGRLADEMRVKSKSLKFSIGQTIRILVTFNISAMLL